MKRHAVMLLLVSSMAAMLLAGQVYPPDPSGGGGVSSNLDVTQAAPAEPVGFRFPQSADPMTGLGHEAGAQETLCLVLRDTANASPTTDFTTICATEFSGQPTRSWILRSEDGTEGFAQIDSYFLTGRKGGIRLQVLDSVGAGMDVRWEYDGSEWRQRWTFAAGEQAELYGNRLELEEVAFANLPTTSVRDGAITPCADCTIANPCASGGTGAIAKRLNGVWVCN